MKIQHELIARIKDESGVTAILVAIVMVVLIGITALAVDIGYVATTKNELQNVADAAALAAANQLGAIYQGMPYDDQETYECGADDKEIIKGAAIDVAYKNIAGGENIIVSDSDVRIGDWNGQSFTEQDAQPDAVQVTARRDGAANGPITTFFAKIFGIDTVDVLADAIAALTGQDETEPGELELPVGISNWFFAEGDRCNDWVKFYPTNDPDSCAGWTSWDYGSNDSNMRDILDGDLESPATDTDPNTDALTDANFTGGTLSQQVFDDLLELFREKGYDYNPDTNKPILTETITNEETGEVETVPVTGHIDPVEHPNAQPIPLYDEENENRLLYPDGTERNHHKWETTIIVYDSEDCSNPNQSMAIVGYALIDLVDVVDAPEKEIRGIIRCNKINHEPSHGGGGGGGLKGSISGLVE